MNGRDDQERDLGLLDDVSRGKGCVAAASSNQGEDLLLIDELLHGADCSRGIAAIIFPDQFQLASVDAASGVDLIEHDIDAVHGELAV